jgi:hypothetical protein
LFLETDSSNFSLRIDRNNLVSSTLHAFREVPFSVIRKVLNVKFVDEEGYGRGVRRCFLNNIIELLSNPSFELFTPLKGNDISYVFISPNSKINENHLQLFFLFGEIMGKCIEEKVHLAVDLPPVFFKFLVYGLEDADMKTKTKVYYLFIYKYIYI